LVENPTTNFNIVRDNDARMEVMATLSFSSILPVFSLLISKKADLNDVGSDSFLCILRSLLLL
jgi:hypothetical protein